MAKQRFINTHFWDDSYIIELDSTEKLLFLYILTNPLTTICGAYEITLRRIAFDTGIDKDMILRILARFEKADKVIYKDGWLLITNFIKNQSLNPKVSAGIVNALSSCPNWVKDRLSISYDSLSKPTIYLNSNLNSNLKETTTSVVVKKDESDDSLSTPSKKIVSKKTDADFLAELSANPAYSHIDVSLEFEKAVVWCSVNNRQPTKRFFVNWLNRIEKLLETNGVINNGSNKPKTNQTTDGTNQTTQGDDGKRLENALRDIGATPKSIVR